MKFQESIRTCLNKYFDFDGDASRSEYWWFVLFIIVVGFALAAVSRHLSGMFSLLTIVPAISAAARRLHDTNRSGWWQLIALFPVIGTLVLAYFLVQEAISGADGAGRSVHRSKGMRRAPKESQPASPS